MNWKDLSSYWAVSGQERALFFRSLATMFQAGCNLDRSLSMLAEQQPNPKLAQAAGQLAQKVQSGRYLSNAMAQLPWAFSQTHIRLMAVGEKTGQLALVLSQLAELEERQTEISLKVRTSLTMPLIVCSLCLVMVALAPPLLFRGIFDILRETGGALPWPTRVLTLFSDGLRHPLAYLVLAALALGGALLLFKIWSHPPWKKRCLRLLHRLPLVGPTLKLVSLTRFAQNLYVTHHVGLPILQGLEYSSQATDDPCLIEDIAWVMEQVKEGEMLGQTLQHSGGFPSAFCQAIHAGEESGSLDDMLQSMAGMYRVDLEHNLELMTKSLEPVMLAIVGSIVGFTVVATLLPMLKVIESL